MRFHLVLGLWCCGCFAVDCGDAVVVVRCWWFDLCGVFAVMFVVGCFYCVFVVLWVVSLFCALLLVVIVFCVVCVLICVGFFVVCFRCVAVFGCSGLLLLCCLDGL